MIEIKENSFTFKNSIGLLTILFFSIYYQPLTYAKDKKHDKLNIPRLIVNQGILDAHQLGKLTRGIVPKQIFFIWVGPNLKRLETFLPNVVRAINLNSEYKVKLLIDTAVFTKPRHPILEIEMAMQEYSFDNKRFTIVDVNQWQDFKKSKYFHQYNDELSGNDANYSAAADILRYYALYKFGGIYVDIDDRLLKSFGEIKLKYSIGTSGYTTLMGSEEFLLLSPIASIKHSPAIKYVLEMAYQRYLEEVLYADTHHCSAAVRHRNPYNVFNNDELAKKIKVNAVLRTSGNIVFTYALTDIFPNLREDHYLPKIGFPAQVTCLSGFLETEFTGGWIEKK